MVYQDRQEVRTQISRSRQRSTPAALPTPATGDHDPMRALSQRLPAKEGSARAPLFMFSDFGRNARTGVTDSSGGAYRGRGPPYWRQEVSRRGDQKAAGCPGCLPVGGPVRRHSSDWPTCWDFRSRVSLWWCDVRPRGHDGERGDASAASPTSPPALEPSPGPSREPSPLELGGAPPPAVARTPVPPPPADWRAARRDRSPPGG